VSYEPEKVLKKLKLTKEQRVELRKLLQQAYDKGKADEKATTDFWLNERGR
jgi:hypothetical protein